jgi:hypothetical protein
MSVTLYEPALRALLDSQEGPVGRFVERKAQAIVLEAQGIIRDYFHRAPTVNVDQDVDYEMQGSTATVGIRDPGYSRSSERSKARRLAEYQARGSFQWLSAAVESEKF